MIEIKAREQATLTCPLTHIKILALKLSKGFKRFLRERCVKINDLVFN